MTPAGAFGALFVALYVGHHVGDHWVQTGHQAITKGNPGWPGRLACARHVATYTLTQLAALGAVAWVIGYRPSPTGIAAGLTISAVTHYIADRRTPLLWLAQMLQPVNGKSAMYQLQVSRPATVLHETPFTDEYGFGTGAYALDQSWHFAWIFVAALVMV